MINLIRNEFFKLHKRHFFLIAFLLIVASAIVYTVVFYLQIDTRSDMDIVKERLEKEKAYFAQIETIQWETDLEMQSAILTSQETIDRLQYMVDHDIADWDWRSDVLSRYYSNQTVLSILAMDQDPADYGYTGFENYDSKATLIQRLNTLCDVQLRMVEENDYMTYSKEQLAALQQEYTETYSQLSVLDAAIKDIEIESWKLYIQYQTPPGAVDQWKSMTIAKLQEEKEWLAKYQYDPDSLSDQTTESLERQKVWNRKQIRINEYALRADKIPLTIYESMAENANTATYSMYLISLKTMMMVTLAICIVLAASIMANEFKRGTIKQLVIYPYSRSAVAGSKLVTYVLTAILLSLILPIFGMVAGRILFSSQSIGNSMSSGAVPSFLTILNDQIMEFPFHLYVFLQYGVELMKILVLGFITLAFATLTESIVGPALIMLILSLAGAQIFSTIYTFVYPVSILRYLLFGNLNLMQYVDGTLIAPYPGAIASIIVISICTIGALSIYFMDFRYKEIFY